MDPGKKIGDDKVSLMGADTDGASSSRSAPISRHAIGTIDGLVARLKDVQDKERSEDPCSNRRSNVRG